MSRGSKFGKTWWGNVWLEALERIDYYTNRLPRGKSYANAGRVVEIKLVEKGAVTAKVKGSRSAPYKVEIKLTPFTAAQKKTLKAIIAQDPSLASELSLGRLPQSILESLKNHNINLLPESWDDFFAKCSCPDWANPCKHLAAVYYILTGEIDKDPFLLFKLRNLEKEELLQAAGFISPHKNDDEKTFLPFLLTYSGAAQLPFIPYAEANWGKEQPAQELWAAQGKRENAAFLFELSGLAEKQDNMAIFSLLSESPLFYPGDNFKTLLLKAYKNIAAALKKQELVENGVNLRDTEFFLLYPPEKKLPSFSFFVTSPQKITPFEGKGEEKNQRVPSWDDKSRRFVLKKKEGMLLPAGAVLDLFLSLPLKLSPEQSSPCADFLCAAASLAQALAASASFVPEVRIIEVDLSKSKSKSGSGLSFYIAYRPLYRSERFRGELEEAINYLAAAMPPGFFFHPQKGSLLTGSAAIQELLTLFLTHIVRRYAGIERRDKICSAFFHGDIYCPERFEEQQTAKAISDWFSWLNLKPYDITPVIHLAPPPAGEKKFRLKVHIEHKNDPLSPPLPLAQVFSEKETLFSRPIEEVRREVAQQLTIVGEHIPILKQLLRHKGKKQAALAPADLAKIITEGRQICSLLGIRVIVPRSLKQIARPAATLAAQIRSRQTPKETVSYFNLQDLLDFTWQVSLGDTAITPEEFRRLAQEAEGVIKFKEQYILLEPEEVKTILEKLNSPPPRLSRAETLRAALTGEAAGVSFRPDEMLKKLLDDIGSEEEVEPPLSLKTELRPYQLRGFRWLYANYRRGLGSCLADDMGLGKTV